MSRDKSEIVLSVENGRGDAARFFIIAVDKRSGKVLYDSGATPIPTIRGRFLHNYRAEILIEENRYRSLIDLSSRKAIYDRRQVYNEASGSLRSAVRIWRNGQSLLQPIDTDNDGIYELKGVINLNGVGRGDPIAYVETTLKYADGAWQVLDSWIAPAEDLANLPQPIRLR